MLVGVKTKVLMTCKVNIAILNPARLPVPLEFFLQYCSLTFILFMFFLIFASITLLRIMHITIIINMHWPNLLNSLPNYNIWYQNMLKTASEMHVVPLVLRWSTSGLLVIDLWSTCCLLVVSWWSTSGLLWSTSDLLVVPKWSPSGLLVTSKYHIWYPWSACFMKI